MSRLRALVREWPWYIVAIIGLAVMAGLVVLHQLLGSVAGVGVFSSLLKLALVPAAVAALFISLRIADRISGFDWPRARDFILANPYSAAGYSAARWIAVAIVLAAVIR